MQFHGDSQRIGVVASQTLMQESCGNAICYRCGDEDADLFRAEYADQVPRDGHAASFEVQKAATRELRARRAHQLRLGIFGAGKGN